MSDVKTTERQALEKPKFKNQYENFIGGKWVESQSNKKFRLEMAILDKEGYLLEKGLIDLETNSLLQKEFNFLVNNLNFRSREAVLHSSSSKGFMYQIPDAGASFFTVNLCIDILLLVLNKHLFIITFFPFFTPI